MNDRNLYNKQGFSLLELVVSMAIFAIIMIMMGKSFEMILKQKVKESGAAESQITDVVGLEMMRFDLEHAGYGLPWSFSSTINYAEANPNSVDPVSGITAGAFNDAPSNPPRAVVKGHDLAGLLNNSDYLVIKSSIVGRSVTSTKWTYTIAGSNPVQWDNAANNLTGGENVIVINPSFGTGPDRQLQVLNNGTFFTDYATGSTSGLYTQETGQKSIIYGIDTAALSAPFNRADYFVSKNVNGDIPTRCAPNTGVLYKESFRHAGPGASGMFTRLPLLDCVADMQVVFGLDTNNSGQISLYSPNLDAYTAKQIRDQLKEVRIYVLAHEGYKDMKFTYPASQPLQVGETLNGVYLGHTYDLTSPTYLNWQNYRWKFYRLVIKPKNL